MRVYLSNKDGEIIMKEWLKKMFWELPLPNDVKQQISQKRYEHILNKEKEYDENGSISLTEDASLMQEYTKFILESYKKKSDYYCNFCTHESFDNDVCLVAYYLTQFHPNAKNDEWWGKGTTEWNNVNQAVPQFVGHYQPRKPGELGYYDLRIADVMHRQIQIAKNYGIGAFCYYYYWFDNGERLLEYPLNVFLNDPSMNMPFFYCWANENWTKRFSGTNNDVLMRISSTQENYKAFIDSVIPDLMDTRYYRIDNRPVISIYRPSLIPNPEFILNYWKERVHKCLGLTPYFIAVQEQNTDVDWCTVGFDAETEFQPKQMQHNCKDITKEVKTIRKDFSGNIYDYKDMVENRKYYLPANAEKKVYPAVMPMWDNTARRNFRGTIFHGSTPDLYYQWLCYIIDITRKRTELDSSLIFINAWNEWGEGAYLEPDDYFGYAYLEATYKALRRMR